MAQPNETHAQIFTNISGQNMASHCTTYGVKATPSTVWLMLKWHGRTSRVCVCFHSCMCTYMLSV